MIGVSSKFSDKEAVREFFELFKTEWEFERPGTQYDVVIRAGSQFGEQAHSPLVIIYSNEICDTTLGSNTASRTGCILRFNKDRLPLSGQCLTFSNSAERVAVDELTHEAVLTSLAGQRPEQTVLWIGYDLWAEIRYLLQKNQPEVYAGIPSLELHIDLLRGLLVEHRVPFSEVRPVPAGYPFVACLTHDVDHASMRAHNFDRTIAGFIYRATIQSLFHFFTGRKSFVELVRNWFAVLCLPSVQLGLLRDPWADFDNYADVETNLPSTYFIVPKQGDAGRLRNGCPAPKPRAVRYALNRISGQLQRIVRRDSEVALHGVDAWLTTGDAKAERDQLRNSTDEQVSAIAGVRMHWLYYDEASPKALDDAGFRYDSTIGYNRTIGYRAGTCQVYRPLGAERLKELPLHIMDTALFFPEYLNCRPHQAKAKIKALISNAQRFGGVLTLNWHDRSIAPERLWQGVYVDVIEELKDAGAWFATASDVVRWFEKRRAFNFDSASNISGVSDGLPALTVKRHGSAAKTSESSEQVQLVAAGC